MTLAVFILSVDLAMVSIVGIGVSSWLLPSCRSSALTYSPVIAGLLMLVCSSYKDLILFQLGLEQLASVGLPTLEAGTIGPGLVCLVFSSSEVCC